MDRQHLTGAMAARLTGYEACFECGSEFWYRDFVYDNEGRTVGFYWRCIGCREYSNPPMPPDRFEQQGSANLYKCRAP